MVDFVTPVAWLGPPTGPTKVISRSTLPLASNDGCRRPAGRRAAFAIIVDAKDDGADGFYRANMVRARNRKSTTRAVLCSAVAARAFPFPSREKVVARYRASARRSDLHRDA